MFLGLLSSPGLTSYGSLWLSQKVSLMKIAANSRVFLGLAELQFRIRSQYQLALRSNVHSVDLYDILTFLLRIRNFHFNFDTWLWSLIPVTLSFDSCCQLHSFFNSCQFLRKVLITLPLESCHFEIWRLAFWHLTLTLVIWSFCTFMKCCLFHIDFEQFPSLSTNINWQLPPTFHSCHFDIYHPNICFTVSLNGCQTNWIIPNNHIYYK